MCGHLGVLIGSLETSKMRDSLVTYFEQALLTGDLRGGDGTGMLAITNKMIYPHKTKESGSDFRNNPHTKKLLSRKDLVALLGHNRKGTQGKVSDENSHPFNYGNITLFHNGTLTYNKALSSKYAVDSESIADSLSKAVDDEDIIKVLEKIDGSFSLVWYDLGRDTINFARNKERPMYFAKAGTGSMVYASESGMLSWLCTRNNIPFKDVVATEVGTWVSFDATGEIDTVVSKKFKPMETFLDDYYYLYDSGSKAYSRTYYRQPTTVVPPSQLPVVVKEPEVDETSILYKKPEGPQYDCCQYCGTYQGEFFMAHGEALCAACAKELSYV